MNRRCRLGVVLAALTLQALVPLAAYAGSATAPGFSDYCSVYRKEPSKAPAAPLPASKHPSSHCAYCPSGAATAAFVPPPVVLTPALAPCDERASTALGFTPSLIRVVIPPSRAPPSLQLATSG